jgi:alpha-glucosidase
MMPGAGTLTPMSSAYSSSAAASDSPAPWWRSAVLYQVYPRSFADSDGDGTGDLRGLTARLDYIADLGVDGLWISPFFPSPMRDFGYDVSDHCGVDPRFGTLPDFDALLARAHALRLKVLIDQVWSHTAAEHAWFIESRSSRDNPKADWYVWADAKPDGSAPNNWQSWMGGPAWRWEPRRRQYHLHNFLPQMPDLNFHCPAVQEAILGIARFWLDRGVDGFRLDTANLYFHDRLLRDNPPLPPERAGESPVLMQRHLHNADQPETLAFLERLRAAMDAYGHGERMAVGEIGGVDGLRTMQDYTAGDQRLHTAYSFDFLGARPDPAAVSAQLLPWQNSDGWPSWAFSNHDAPRVASRWGAGAARGFDFGAQASAVDDANAALPPETWMALLLCLRGTIFLYQGEELGLPQSEIPFEQMQDPFGIANWPLSPGRDGCRTPMPWQAEAPNAGFSTGTPWLPMDPAHVPLAVDRQQAETRSMLHTTRRLIALRRQHPVLRDGDLEVLHADGATLLLRRRCASQTLWAAFNLSAHGQTLSIPEPLPDTPVWQYGGALLHDLHLYLPGGAVWIAVDNASTP